MYVHVIFQSYECKVNYSVWFTIYIHSKKSLSSMIWKVWAFKFAFSSFAFSRGDTSLHMFLFIPISLCNDDLHEEETEVRENGGIGLINNTCKALIDYQQPLSFLLTFFAWTAELISIVSRMHSYVPTKIWIFNKSKVSLTAWVQNVFDMYVIHTTWW